MKIAVFCASKDNIDPLHNEAAKIVGQWIGAHKASLVYGGMNFGLMKIVANQAKNYGAKVVGVIPITHKNAHAPLNDENILVSDLNERKAIMTTLSDIFVVLPGGYGTLDELITTFTSLSFARNKSKKIIIININGLFDHTIAQLKAFADIHLMEPNLLHRINVVTNVNECCLLLDKFHKNKTT